MYEKIKITIQSFSRQKALSAGFFLIAATMVGNVLNFVFNAFLGRELSPADFGTVAVLNTIIYLSSIIIGSLSGTVNHHTAYIEAKRGPYAGVSFVQSVQKYGFYISLAFSGVWLLSLPFIASFFQINSISLLAYCTPFILCGILGAAYKGFIQGNFDFTALGIVLIFEAFMKLMLAGFFVYAKLTAWTGLSIPLSIVCSFFLAWIYTAKIQKKIQREAAMEEENKEELPFRFPRRFYFASVLAGLSSALFLSIDVILVKHYFDPVIAGQYSLLALIGKIVFFLGSLLNVFIITLVSNDEGEGRNPHTNFYKIVWGTVALLVGAFIALGPLGYITVPLLFGAKSLPILPYISEYSIATALFTIASTIVTFHLARKQYLFSVVSLIMAGVFSLGIVMYHSSIGQVIDVFEYISALSLAIIIGLHILQRNGKFILANIVDLINVFSKLPKVEPTSPDGKRILMFNWRDTKHTYAGGAESYVHELAKRWVASGHAVTLFAGNDGKNPENEIIDGVNIFRRGGTYTVYPWACIYYIFRFRGTYDVIIDSQNGVPFFTPLYAKEKVFSLLHHVHQEIFYKFLPRPLAFVGATLENRAMPWVYRDTRFLTVSESTKTDMEDLGITRETIDIVHPGVDLSNLEPGEKSKTPLILSIGRLKAYKSIDILIKAFKIVSEKFPDATLIIGGDGEERKSLEALVEELGFSDKIRFVGKISEEEKIRLLQQAWVFVNPSMMEGWGITTIEANACGVPVVASDVSGLKDSVQHEQTGFLVEYGNISEFAEKISQIISNEGLRKEMGKESLDWAQKFDWDHLADNCLKIIL